MNRLDGFQNVVFIALLGMFSVIIPIGVWRLNIVWVILFARVYNLAFSNVHFSSVLAVSAASVYLVIRDRKSIQPYKWIAVMFATASIHEWGIFFWDWVILKAPIAAWQDAIWFTGFLILGVAFANRRQRIILGILTVYLFALMGIYVGYFHDSDLEIGIYTLQTFQDNFIEVFGWMSPYVFWWLVA